MASEYINNKTLQNIIKNFQDSKTEKAKYELLLKELRDSLKRKSNRSIPTDREDELIPSYSQKYNHITNELDLYQERLAKEFYTLSERIALYTKFNLIDDEDAIQEGVWICFEKIDRFDPVKGKAFNYLTTCILHHFRQLYRSAKNYNELKKKYSDHLQAQATKKIIKNKKEISINRKA